MPYSVDTIHSTLERIFNNLNDKVLMRNELDRLMNKSELRAELNQATFIPEVGRMIAVSDKLSELATSTRYGMFEGMTPRRQYRIGSGRYSFARPLTVDEIAKCF